MDAATTTMGTRLEPRRLLGMGFVVLTLVIGMFLSRLVAAGFSGLRLSDPALLGVEDLTVSSVIGFALALGLALWAWTNPRTQGAGLEVATELKKVTWPSMAETRVSTVAVIIASVVASAILFVFDFVASKIMTEWLPSVLGWFARV